MCPTSHLSITSLPLRALTPLVPPLRSLSWRTFPDSLSASCLSHFPLVLQDWASCTLDTRTLSQVPRPGWANQRAKSMSHFMKECLELMFLWASSLGWAASSPTAWPFSVTSLVIETLVFLETHSFSLSGTCRWGHGLPSFSANSRSVLVSLSLDCASLVPHFFHVLFLWLCSLLIHLVTHKLVVSLRPHTASCPLLSCGWIPVCHKPPFC